MRTRRPIKRSVRRTKQALARASLRVGYALEGIEAVNERLLRATRPEWILRAYGADVGSDCVLHGPVVIHNADADYSNLVIGKHVHLGRGCLLDLTGMIAIEDEACISMGCTILTHTDVGSRPLAELYPRQVSGIRIGAGAYLGANVTLVGSSVGELAVVAAGSVVLDPVESRTLAAGTPARAKRRLQLDAQE